MLVTVGPVVAGPWAHGVRSLKKLGCGVQSRGLSFGEGPSRPCVCFPVSQVLQVLTALLLHSHPGW